MGHVSFSPQLTASACLSVYTFVKDLMTDQIPYLFDYPPWALIKFLDLESGRLFEAGRLLNFHHFQQVKYVYFATKQ